MKNDIKLKFNAIRTYLNEGSLKKVAAKYHVHPVTLCRWANNFKNSANDFYKPHWARLELSVEKKVMLLKENNPSLSAGIAQCQLARQGIHITAKVIHSIWRRYNLANRLHNDLFSPFARTMPETQCKMEYINLLLKHGMALFPLKKSDLLRKSATILNDMPSIPYEYSALLSAIPENLLNPRRRLERLCSSWGKIPVREYIHKTKEIRMELEKKGYLYSSIFAGVMELIALHRMRSPDEELKLNSILRKRKGKLRDAELNFTLEFLAGTAHVEKIRVKKAFLCVKKCKRILRTLQYPVYIESCGDFMTALTDFNEGLYFYNKSMEKAKDKETVKRLGMKISSACVLNGRYREALRFLHKNIFTYGEDHYESYCLCQAFAYLGIGEYEKASTIVQNTLEKVEIKQFRNSIYAASFCLAAISQLLGNTKKGVQIIKRYLPLFKKYKLTRERKILLFTLNDSLHWGKSDDLPAFRLLHLLKRARKSLKLKDYKKMLQYAKKHGLIGFLHRLLIFKPELVVHLLNLGLNLRIPKSLLKMPIFNKGMPVYYIRFLGNLSVLKNQKRLHTRLSPKQRAFLIHFVDRAGTPGKSQRVSDINQNFWRRSNRPTDQLSHTLVQIKNELKLPRHLISFVSNGEKILLNKGVAFTTDYQDFTTAVVQAKALERAGEWNLAKREYLRAFKLVRGEPFKKMYDPWSEHMRYRILNQLEAEAISFKKSCLQHGYQREVKKIIGKVLKIIPGSKES
jgi:hypothetical protein